MTGPDAFEEDRFLTYPLRLGPAVLMESEQISLGPMQDRDSVAGQAIDHFRVSMSLDDEAVRVSDSGCRTLSLTVPRAVVAPLLADPHSAQAEVILANTPFAQLMQEHLLALRRHGPQLTQAEGKVAAHATVRLLAGGLGCAPKAERAGTLSARETLLAAIKTYIEQNLTAPMLDAGRLCRRFGLSRATLYRLFKPEGGLGRYILQRRLRRSLGQLASPQHHHWSIIDFALDNRFGNDASFIRAFRRQFGVTPGEVRVQAEAASPLTP